MPNSLSELDLIRELGNRLDHPLEEIPEDRFRQHVSWTRYPDFFLKEFKGASPSL